MFFIFVKCISCFTLNRTELELNSYSPRPRLVLAPQLKKLVLVAYGHGRGGKTTINSAYYFTDEYLKAIKKRANRRLF